jgi:hypothetical protein
MERYLIFLIKLGAYILITLLFSCIYYGCTNKDDWGIIANYINHKRKKKNIDYFDMLYFSTVVSSLLGLGDIFPVSAFAKKLVMLELFFAIAIFYY